MSHEVPKSTGRWDFYLLLTMLMSSFLQGYNIWTDKYANTYYTTAVGSMLQSWHNFFFVSLDSAGSVTVDKPPLTFWIQALSAKIFGLHGWSVILPQALSGVLSVWLIYKLMKPSFGIVAARIAAVAMATMPIAVAVGRTNNIDSMLVFALLIATWLLMKGVRSGSAASVIGAFAVVGLAFNMKMMQAYMVLPAFYLLYAIAFRMPWRKKAAVAAGATATLLVVSLLWALIVDSVPASKRPYIGSSTNNSVMELALGYNGVSRLTGENGPGGGGGGFGRGGMFGDGGGGQAQNAAPTASTPDASAAVPQDGNRQDGGIRGVRSFPSGMDNRFPGGGANSGGMFGTGQKGALRLFQSELSGQASWLIPFAAFGALALLLGMSLRKVTAKHEETLFWLAWLLPVMGFFSIAGFFHPYYLIMLAPPIAALVGGGWSELWRMYRDSAGWKSSLLPIAIVATTTFAWYVLHPNDLSIGKGWSMGVLFGGFVIAIALVLGQWSRNNGVQWTAFVGLALMLIGPIYWALTPIAYGQNSMLPQAGIASDGRGMGMGIGMGGGIRAGGWGGVGEPAQGAANEKLIAYLHAHNNGETYLFATENYGTAAPYIIDKNEKVITLNGFNGGDQVYTTETLQELVSSGKVKYFLLGEGMGGGPGGQRGGSSGLTQWIEEHGTEIPSDEWQTSSSTGGGFGSMNNMKLYEVHS
ncbi:glycosyltransferase family 39 protein [Cohnella endophytica]|uniref:Glycosyltransferase family 39 protein n=1 Tax=Cohnella endophytica TaxID=2419778 RepID=A0A494XDY7_9BACL|nr:glycosyltransferase family 39 protein [Cohnella endophytica]RKP48860.1 glycosyltransferase family 39 protein [Cohnella endophytica]